MRKQSFQHPLWPREKRLATFISLIDSLVLCPTAYTQLSMSTEIGFESTTYFGTPGTN